MDLLELKKVCDAIGVELTEVVRRFEGALEKDQENKRTTRARQRSWLPSAFGSCPSSAGRRSGSPREAGIHRTYVGGIETAHRNSSLWNSASIASAWKCRWGQRRTGPVPRWRPRRFQSTLPVGAATCDRDALRGAASVSIHAARGGSDIWEQVWYIAHSFQSTLPVAKRCISRAAVVSRSSLASRRARSSMFSATNDDKSDGGPDDDGENFHVSFPLGGRTPALPRGWCRWRLPPAGGCGFPG